ncbi:MAG TPA: S9 family peptidase [Pseudomonadota bacterium]|nr:S9 family peptidase [Pseudomonadota bacterium]
MSRTLLAGLLLAVSLAAAAAPRPLTADDLWAMQRVAQPAVSPDGQWVAFVVTHYDTAANTNDSDLWLVPAAGGTARRVAGNSGSATAPFWSNEGQLGFLLAREGQPAQPWSLRIGAGEPQPLAQLPVAVKRARWLPGGRALVFEALTFPDLDARFAEVQARVDALRADKTQARISESRLLRYWDRYLTDGMVPHLFELDVASGAVRDLMPGFDRITGFEGFEWDLSADGAEIAFSANNTAPPHRELNFDIYALDRARGTLANLTPASPGADTRPVYGPRAHDLLFGRTARAGIPSDFTRLVLLERAPAREREVAAGLDAAKGAWVFGADGRSAWFNAERDGRVDLYQASFAGTKARRMAEGGSIDAIERVDDGVVYLRHDFSHPAELHRYDPHASGRVRRLTAFNDGLLAKLAMGRVERFDYPGVDGDAVQAWLAYPPDYRANQRYPLLFLAHGGPFTSWTDAWSYRWNAQVFAARGWLVAIPNFHGSMGRGQAYADAILGNHGEKPAADVLALLDVMSARRDVDGSRAALAGGSYGGYLTALVTGMSPRFRAAIVHAGVFDISGQFASDSTWDRPASYGNAPWTDPVELDRWSPSRFVPRMQTPTLVLHGEKDFRVPVSQGINLHGALTGKGVPARIVVFPDENHWIMRPQASQLWHREFFAWLDRHAAASPKEEAQTATAQ